MISVSLVPVMKDKSGKVDSSDSYRPIALASVLSKVFESIPLDRIEEIITSTDHQFGFKGELDTDMVICSLKEIINRYRDKTSSVFMSFIDASKAFDQVNHFKLFAKISQRGIPHCVGRILWYWHANQSGQVKRSDFTLAPFGVSNGI